MSSQERRIPFPFGGLTTDRGYQSSDPQTTRDAVNVAPDDSSEARTRGGSRPGLTKRYTNNIGGTPLYMVRVSADEDELISEFLVVGTVDNMFVGKSVPSGVTPPVTYTETLSPLTGELLTQSGQRILTQASPAEPNEEFLIVDEFDLESINRCVVVAYKGKVIFGPTDNVLATGVAANSILSAPGGLDEATLVDSGGIDFTAIGLDLEKHWIEITDPAGGINDGTYLIKSIDNATTLTIEGNPFGSGVVGGATPVNWTIRVGVRILDPSAQTLNLLTPTGGFVPVGASAVAVYRDRVVWGIGREWIMSRIGDPGDYDIAANPEDPTRAIAGRASEAGQPGAPITAMATGGYDYLVIWNLQSTWIMRGDPGFGGQLYNTSPTVGCVACKAWCEGETTELYFLGKEGLYYLPPDAGEPKPLSPDKLPRELRGVDRVNNYVTLAYDPEDNGVLILVVPRTIEQGSHFWYSQSTDSFWPVQFANNSHQPTDAVTFAGSPVQPRRITLACIDGFIRGYTGTDDDGTAIMSHLIMGPYPTTNERDLDGILTELVTTLDEQSVPVTLQVYIDRSPEGSVIRAQSGVDPDWSDTARPGREWNFRPRRRGDAFCIRINATGPWAFEGLFAKLAVAGKVRR